MSKSNYEKALEIISDRRSAALNTADEHTREIERKIPEFAEINAKLTGTIYELMKLMVSGKGCFDEKFAEIKKTNLNAQKMITDLLIRNNYPDDYLEPHFTCVKCGDTGFVNGNKCTCLAALTEKLAIDDLNSHSIISLYSFDSFDLSYYSGSDKNNMSCILNYCKDYSKNFSLKSDSIFMRGDTGLGKTHLSLSIAKEAVEKGYNVAYDSIINYLSKIEKEHFGRSDDDTLSKLLAVDLLILDDLGTEYPSPFYPSVIYNIINTRISRHFPTIISSNLTTDEFQSRYDDRVVSRLFGTYKYLQFSGNDVRQLKIIKNS